MQKICSKCHSLKDVSEFNKSSRAKDGLQSDCRLCHSLSNRALPEDKLLIKRQQKRNWYLNNKERAKEYYKRIDETAKKARYTLNNAIQSGVIRKHKCYVCGTAKAQAHHEDYTKPLDVIWLCGTCHSRYHNGHFCLKGVPRNNEFSPNP